MNKQKGFTIIELIVVIAIIAVLAAIVMVNVTKYIATGKDASIKGNMSSMTTIAASVYDSNGSVFTGAKGLAANAAWTAGVLAIKNANGAVDPTVNIIADAWCIASPLNTAADGPWCADSTGFKGKVSATTVCDTTNANCAAD